ncbi:Disease resistance protein RGA2 [Rhynchospora pubera]|uniref:Disease resistance protein RGA2 n=1 Tax=Rhynchospora pubera TaxID=906938 RepID=A0AAV8BR61_9POAL|nr:Disease resistance protein RGA2 [Rhynchospora pubera]
MTGFELIVGGRFASSIIGKIIDAARSYLGNNYDLQSGTTDMLTSLENSLPQIQAAIELASKRPITNRGLATWLNSLKNAAYEAEDVLDDLETKRTRESSKGKNKFFEIVSSSGKIIKTLILSDKELKGLKSSVNKLCQISMGVGDFINLLQHEYINAKPEYTGTHTRETSSNLDPNAKIFGRDKELSFILDIILNYQFLQGNSDQQPESRSILTQGNPQLPYQREVQVTNSFWGNGAILRASKWFLCLTRFGKENKNDVRREGKNQEMSNIKLSVGRQNSVCIMDWTLPVLPIFGLGGVGKTTIAKMVYNNERVADSFSIRAWVYVSEYFDAKKIMKEIVLSLGGGSNVNTIMDLYNIEKKLIETIKNRRFFLVLDDLHDGIEFTWNGLLSVLGNGAPGSIVLVTTQSEHVAKTIGNMPNIITLHVLESKCFEQLLEYYALGELQNPSQWQYCLEEEELTALKLIAKRIAAKLHGLPLVGEVIGKLLRTQLERVHWENDLKSEWWDDEHALKGIIPSLGIGYMDLDPELKQCFAFCSIFPKNYVFDRNRLVQMWMSHGFIQPNEMETNKLDKGDIRLEDVGGKYFDKLVSRSLFQATISDGKYIMHDLIRDLAIAVSSNEFCYVKNDDGYLPSSARHLAIDSDNSKIEGETQNNTRLRSLILFGNWKNYGDESIRSIFAKSNSLRLLDLSYIGIETNATIYAICLLSHLRYVDLSFSGIKLIPDEFCLLWHLQVLDVRGCNFQKLPKGMNKLINLRHLYANVETISLISGIGKLTNLQELEEFHIAESEGYRISELRDMNEIRGHLLLSNLQHVSSKEEAATSQLAKKKYLKNLELEFNYKNDQLTTRIEQEVLETLKPYSSVEVLTIKGCRFKYLPGWVLSTHNGFSNLKCIQLRNFWLTTFPAFGALPSLEVLSFDELQGMEMIGDEFYGHFDVVFPSLKELTFSNMSRWRVWSSAPAGKMSFPHLKKIHIENCWELIYMPTNFFASSMAELKLIWCPNIRSITTILQGMPSLKHLSITSSHENLSIYCTPLNSLEVMRLSCHKKLHFVGSLKSLVNLRKLVLMQIDDFMESFKVEQENNEISQENQEQCLQFLTYLHLGHSYCSTHSLLSTPLCFGLLGVFAPQY